MQLARTALALLLGLLVLVVGSRSALARDGETPVAGDGGAAVEPPPAPDAGAPDAPPAPDAPDAAVGPPAEAAPAAPDRTSNVTIRANTEIAGYLDSTATSVLTPSLGGTVENPTAGWAINGRYLLDVVSAASPDIVSTASPNWKEVRQAGNLGFRYKPSTLGVAGSVGTSYTPDYLSLSGGIQLTQELDEKNLTLVQGYGYGHDTIGRTGTPFSVFSRTLQYHSLSLGASRVVNSGLVIGLYGDAILERGDQSKPYRYIPLFAPEVAAAIPRGASATQVQMSRSQARPLEQLPLERDRFALTARLAWRAGSTTLRVEERGYADSWGLRASTTDVRYFIDVSPRVTIWPHARFNVQNGVDFWQRAYASLGARDIPALRAGDRELGPLHTIGGGGGLRFALGKAGATEDIVLSTTLDGYWTSFRDAIYVQDRLSGLTATTLDLAF
ncbi:MAG TPA: DUF3570 domain-containing protein [Labilithrix sp.]|nr:DUF3570 domain-containing protein [Labilithrix sp.]